MFTLNTITKNENQPNPAQHDEFPNTCTIHFLNHLDTMGSNVTNIQYIYKQCNRI